MWRRGSDGVKEPQSWRSKAGILRASRSLVILTTYDVPVNMLKKRRLEGKPTYKYRFKGRGIILTSEAVDDSTYKSIIIAPALLFKRPDDIPLHQVQFDVSSSDGKLLCNNGELMACDFHYNLAAIIILTNFPLQPATLASLTDVSSIDVAAYQNHSPLAHHSDLFKVQPGTKIIVLCSSFYPPFSVYPAPGVFSASHITPHSCKELYWVDCPGIKDNHSGGAVINRSGQFLGILLHDCAFLPSNFISRWWSHYISTGEFRRPLVGVEITNLAEARLSFLEQFKNSFSNISVGVIVTKVEKDTPADWCGTRLKDVVVKCDGKWVQSKIEFFESMWNNTGKSVKLTVLRASDGEQLDLSMSISETSPTNFHRWDRPHVSKVLVSDASSDELSDHSCDELSDNMVLDPVNARHVRRYLKIRVTIPKNTCQLEKLP